MTIGIYSLYFNSSNSVYIGQSTNIELRVTQHLAMLESGLHYNYKLLDAYKQYGSLEYEILKICNISDLDSLEIELINEFDSISNGFNITSGGSGGGRGTEANPSIYTKQQILEVVDLLCENRVPKYIQSITGVGHRAIASIQSGISHLWVKELVPDKWEIISKNLANRKSYDLESQGKACPVVEGPDGTTYTITNISEFARHHNINRRSLNRAILERHKTHKGFKILT